MNEEGFSFTSEQKDNLKNWKALLSSEKAQGWAVEEKEAIDSIHNILEETGFKKGNDLKPGELDSVFRHMKALINNRALARNLYEENGLTEFNSRLRNLFFSDDPLPNRVNQFLDLKKVGLLTVSHFLCAFSPTEYPEVGWQTLDMLDLNDAQSNKAYEQAMREHSIASPEDYHEKTIEYLSDMIIFREIKTLLDIEEYNRINDLLWLARPEVEGDLKPTPTSISLEKDLRDYLAENPDLIEKGLSLVGKEHPIEGAGRADLLCKDKRGNYIVIETKKARESEKVVGQILKYIGGLKKEGKKTTRGIIIVNEPDDKLDLAIEAVKDLIKLKYYKVSFEITDSPTST